MYLFLFILAGFMLDNINKFVGEVHQLHRNPVSAAMHRLIAPKSVSKSLKTAIEDSLKILKQLDKTENLDDLKQKINDGSCLDPDKKKFVSAVEDLFFNILPQQKYNLSTLIKYANIPKSDRKLLENFLSKDIQSLRKAKEENPSLKSDPDHQIKRRIAKAKLAEEVGAKAISAKGATGTLILKGLSGKSLAVFKLSESHVSWIVFVKNWFKANFGLGQLSFLSRKKMAQPLAEKASYIVSRELGFNLAPATERTEIGKKAGVFIIFIKNDKEEPFQEQAISDVKQAGQVVKTERLKYQEAKTALEQEDNFANKTEYSPEELTTFQKFAVFDYLIGNLDRHTENWFVTIKDEKLQKIKTIDNANSFPKKLPRPGSRALHNQYQWKNLGIAAQPWTDETKRFVKENLTPAKIDDLLKKIGKEISDFFEGDMKDLFIKRAAVIFQNIDTPQSAKDLADIH